MDQLTETAPTRRQAKLDTINGGETMNWAVALIRQFQLNCQAYANVAEDPATVETYLAGKVSGKLDALILLLLTVKPLANKDETETITGMLRDVRLKYIRNPAMTAVLQELYYRFPESLADPPDRAANGIEDKTCQSLHT